MNTQEIIKTIETNQSIGLSEKDIADFEKEINWRFPTNYREILIQMSDSSDDNDIDEENVVPIKTVVIGESSNK